MCRDHAGDEVAAEVDADRVVADRVASGFLPDAEPPVVIARPRASPLHNTK